MFWVGYKTCHNLSLLPTTFPCRSLNRNLRNALIAYHSEAYNTGDQNLTWLQFAFNMAGHDSTKVATFAVIFPLRSSSPLINWWKINELIPDRCSKRSLIQKWKAVRQNLLKSHNKMASRYNQNRVPAPFQVGDLVYYRNNPVSHAGLQITAKPLHRWKGPFKVERFSLRSLLG